MTKRWTSQVDPRITAVVIIAVLAVVQYVWWKGLVSKPKDRPPGPPAGNSARGPDNTLRGPESILVVTLAGDPEPGTADGPGREARFDTPCGLALDPAGSLLVADSRNHRIRRVEPNGRTSTVAGGEQGFRDGPAAQAQFNTPCGVAAGPDGSIYVADSGNNRIRLIRGGNVTTLAGGELGFADGPAAQAKFKLPVSIAAAPARSGVTLYVADSGNRRVRAISPSGVVTSLPQLAGAPSSVAVNAAGAVYAAVPKPSALAGLGGAPAVPLPGAKLALKAPLAIWPAPGGEWYVSDYEHNALFRLRPGAAETLAGGARLGQRIGGFRDGNGYTSNFGGSLGGVIADGKGHIFVSDTANNAIRKLTLPAG